MKKQIRQTTAESGFTLVEVVLAAGILAFILVAMVKVFIYSSTQAELAGNKTLATLAAQSRLEEIRNHDYDSIVSDYDGSTFDPPGLNGKGKVYVGGSAELLEIEIVVCWQDKYNRIIGEDKDLDGVLDVGEDIDGNSKISSPVTVVTGLTRR